MLGDGSQHFKTQVKIASAVFNPINGPIIIKTPQDDDTVKILSHENSNLTSVQLERPNAIGENQGINSRNYRQMQPDNLQMFEP